jgi:hypothetical protein
VETPEPDIVQATGCKQPSLRIVKVIARNKTEVTNIEKSVSWYIDG